MKILLACPIIDKKQYCIYEWLDSVVALINNNVQVFLVDNSDDDKFVNTVKDYCHKIKLDIKIIHLLGMKGKEGHARIAESHKEIQKEIIIGNYDYWFSLECDVIVPSNTLDLLLKHIEGVDVVRHCYPEKTDSNIETDGIGCALFKRNILLEFSLGEWGLCDKLKPQRYYSNDLWLHTQMWRAGKTIKDLHGVIKPIKHL
jgi:hypothetical protein